MQTRGLKTEVFSNVHTHSLKHDNHLLLITFLEHIHFKSNIKT